MEDKAKCHWKRTLYRVSARVVDMDGNENCNVVIIDPNANNIL